MIDEHSTKTKADVIDFIIDFLIEHEKNMDRIVTRLEKTLESQTRRTQIQDHPIEPKIVRENDQNPFVLTIKSPGGFKSIKSVKLDWDDETQLTDISALIKKLEEAQSKESQ